MNNIKRPTPKLQHLKLLLDIEQTWDVWIVSEERGKRGIFYYKSRFIGYAAVNAGQ